MITNRRNPVCTQKYHTDGPEFDTKELRNKTQAFLSINQMLNISVSSALHCHHHHHHRHFAYICEAEATNLSLPA